MSTFDVLSYIKGAEAIGIKREHAEYQAEQFNKLLDNSLTTKKDLNDLEIAVKRDLKDLENKLTIKLGGLIVFGMSILGFILKH